MRGSRRRLLGFVGVVKRPSGLELKQLAEGLGVEQPDHRQQRFCMRGWRRTKRPRNAPRIESSCSSVIFLGSRPAWLLPSLNTFAVFMAAPRTQSRDAKYASGRVSE